MHPYLLGTDIGTGSVKVIATDLSGRLIDSLQYDHSFPASEPGRSEQDPEQLMDTWIKAVADMVSRQQTPPQCISFSSAMHGLMAVDNDGHPLSPLITWSDLRASGVAEGLRTSAEARSIYEHTGTPIHAMSPLCKLIWLRENETELFKRAHRFVSIKEYIWQKLFGVWEIDYSIASATGLFDIEQKQWHGPALELAGIKSERLSQPVPTTHLRSGCTDDMARKLGMNGKVSFCVGASDGCLANLGTRAMRTGVAALTIGTSGAVRMASPKPLPEWPEMPFSYVLDEDHFICGGPVNNGGNIVQWLIKKFCAKNINEEIYTKIFDEAALVEADGLVFLPHLFGERAPVWDEQSRGVYFGIGPQHGRAHFIRAALEGICFNLKNVLLQLEQQGAPVACLCVSGGFTRSPFWTQLLADITGKKLWVPPAADASATGAAWLALKALGHDISTLMELPADASFIKPKNTTEYEKSFSIFQQLYPALRSLMH